MIIGDKILINELVSLSGIPLSFIGFKRENKSFIGYVKEICRAWNEDSDKFIEFYQVVPEKNSKDKGISIWNGQYEKCK